MSNPSIISLINTTIMNGLIHCAVNKDFRTLEALGVNEKSVAKLTLLSNKGRYLIDNSPAPIAQTTIDNKALDLYIDRFMNKEKEDEFINQLILAEAPLNILSKNYGIDRQEYSSRRIALHLNKTKRGRPELPDIDECPDELYRFIEQYIQDKSNKDISEDPELLLSLSDQHKIGIREVMGFYIQISKELM